MNAEGRGQHLYGKQQKNHHEEDTKLFGRYSHEEMGAGKFAGCAADSNALNLPVYISPIAVVFNVDGVTALQFSPSWLRPSADSARYSASLPATRIFFW